MNISQINGNPIYDKDAHTQLNNKVDKVEGKGLSTNDFTNEYKSDLDNLPQTITSAISDKSSYMLQDFETPLSTNDVGDKTIPQFEVEGNSTQDGTPTPTAPIDIENTGDTLKLTSCGKNLIPYPYSETMKTVNGITFTDNGDGTITANGTATANAMFRFISNNPTILNGSYTLSGCPAGGGYGSYYLQAVSKYDLSNNVSFTATNTAIGNCFIVIQSGVTANNLVFKPQLEIGSTATSYEPYVGNTYTIPLTDTAGTTHTMRKYDVVKKHDDGKWYFESNSSMVSFDGTESWTLGTDGKFYLNTASLGKALGNYNLLSSRYKLSTASQSNMDDKSIVGNYSNYLIYIRDTDIASIDAWKAQLAAWNTAGNPLTVLYQTETATSYELNATAQDLLNSITAQSPTANIYFTNETQPTMTGKYRLDAKRYIDNKFAELQAAITALGNS